MARNAAKTKEQKPIEQTLWDAANKLRGKVEPAEYKHVALLCDLIEPYGQPRSVEGNSA